MRRLPLPCPARATANTVAAHHLFAETAHPPRASAALRGRLQAGLPLSPTAFSAAVARSGPDALPALHALAVASGLAAFAPVTNSLAARYAKGNSFPAAARVFAAARSRDTRSYNTILSATPDPDDALAFAARMLRTGDVRPDAVTFTVTLSLAAGRGEARLVRQLHALASRAGIAADVFVGNALVTAYSRSGSMDAARKVFEEMPARDLVSWNALVCGLAQDGECSAEVIRVFLRMLKQGDVRPDRISICSVIPACGAEGKLELGRQIHGFARGRPPRWTLPTNLPPTASSTGCVRAAFPQANPTAATRRDREHDDCRKRRGLTGDQGRREGDQKALTLFHTQPATMDDATGDEGRRHPRRGTCSSRMQGNGGLALVREAVMRGWIGGAGAHGGKGGGDYGGGWGFPSQFGCGRTTDGQNRTKEMSQF